MRIRRDLLVKMTLARSARTKFDKVVVSFHERHHAQQKRVLLPCGQRGRLISRTAQQEVLPLLGRECLSGIAERL